VRDTQLSASHEHVVSHDDLQSLAVGMRQSPCNASHLQQKVWSGPWVKHKPDRRNHHDSQALTGRFIQDPRDSCGASSVPWNQGMFGHRLGKEIQDRTEVDVPFGHHLSVWRKKWAVVVGGLVAEQLFGF